MTTHEGVNPQMIANNQKSFQSTHSGEVLKDELEHRGISQRGLAKEIGISYSAFNEILNGKWSLSPDGYDDGGWLRCGCRPLLVMQNEFDMLMATAISSANPDHIVSRKALPVFKALVPHRETVF